MISTNHAAGRADLRVTVLVAVLAGLVASYTFHLFAGAPALLDGAPAAVADRVSEDRLAELVGRLERVEQTAGESRQAAAGESGDTRREVADAESQRAAMPRGLDRTLAAWLRQLDQRISDLERFQRESTDERSQEERALERREEERAIALARAPMVILDPREDAWAKAQAWSLLRHADASTWTDPVVAEMVRLGRFAEDADVRADVWRQADAGRVHPLLMQPLLEAALNDAEARVRSEAAETLANYTDDAGVRAALEGIAASDPDPEVRAEARRALDRRR